MSLRPPNPPKITLDDLQPGDILLSAGDPSKDILDRLILLIDQGDYTHTTQYIGKDPTTGKHMVVEATEEGIKYWDTKADSGQLLIDAYRYVSPDGHKFGDPDWPVQPVLDEAMSYVGAKYAYSELILGAVVIMAAKAPANEHLKEIIRLAGDYIEHQLEKWLTENADKIPMTCVQVATSAHWQAKSNPPNKYALQAVIDGSRTTTSSDDMKEYQALRSRITQKIQAAAPHLAVGAENGGLKVTIGKDIPLGSCTPRDMETSPTLQFVGCIQDNRKKTSNDSVSIWIRILRWLGLLSK